MNDKRTDTVLIETDPDNWPGAGKAIDKHTKQERGDRYWSKKNAAATLTLLTKMHTLIGILASIFCLKSMNYRFFLHSLLSQRQQASTSVGCILTR